MKLSACSVRHRWICPWASIDAHCSSSGKRMVNPSDLGKAKQKLGVPINYKAFLRGLLVVLLTSFFFFLLCSDESSGWNPTYSLFGLKANMEFETMLTMALRRSFDASSHSAYNQSSNLATPTISLGGEDRSLFGNGSRECTTGSDCPSGKRCVNRTCVCPVLFSGSENCAEPSSGIKTGCISPMNKVSLKKYARSVNVSLGNAEFDHMTGDLPSLSTFDSCAVVGSSSSLVKGYAYGQEIDSHATVIRFNDAPTKGFEKWVGSKTTMRIQNVIYCGFAESPEELCMRYTARERRGGRIDLRHTCSNRYSCTPVNGTHPMVLYAMGYWRLSSLPKQHSFRKMSAGFFGIALSLHLCGQVDVYGIEGGELHYYVKSLPRGRLRHKSHQQDACTLAGCSSKKSFGQRHSWQLEKRCLEELKLGFLPRLSVKL